MKLYYSLLLLFCAPVCFSQDIFDIEIVHKIEINFFDLDWDHQLDSLASLETGIGSGTDRILANVIINGTALDSCGVRYKGNSSMDTTSNKNPFNIDLNYIISSQEYQGKDKIKLANCFTDPSMVREALTYEIANQYMDCPRGSFVELYINDEYRGIYTNTESVDNEFLNMHYGSSNNPFFKCDPNIIDLYGANSNLAYYTDTTDYAVLYDMKSDFGLEELQAFTYQLTNEPATIGNYLDVDRALWFLALSDAFVHNDGYTAFAHNFYFYKMDNGKWSIVLWDVNMAFGGLLWNGTNLFPLLFGQLAEQDPFLHAEAYAYRPLIAQLLSTPKYRKMYVAHYRTIIEENIRNNHYLNRAETMHDLIDSYVEIEPYSHFTYTEFNENIYTNVGFLFNLRPGLENLMTEREIYLNDLTEFGLTQPSFNEFNISPTNPFPYTVVNFTTEVIDANEVQFAYRFNPFDSFIYEDMFDDGSHGDGAAGDGIFGINIPVLATDMEYYFYAENADAGKFSPVRAAYEFYTLSPRKGLVINEILASNSSFGTDENGDYDDWIELYNNSDESINLDGYHLSDNMDDLNKWSFPSVSIAAGDYLIIWADSDSMVLSGNHTNFNLSASGESVSLTDDAGQLIDQIVFLAQSTDVSFGRYANGIGDFEFLSPTFNAVNDYPIGFENENLATFNVFPNPAKNTIRISYTENQNTTVSIYSINGMLVLEKELKNTTSLDINISSLKAGLYIITDKNGRFFKLVVE